jgi:hypothetical protein
MGLADRDYMKAGYWSEQKKERRPSWVKRLRFFLYRLRRSLFKS